MFLKHLAHCEGPHIQMLFLQRLCSCNELQAPRKFRALHIGTLFPFAEKWDVSERLIRKSVEIEEIPASVGITSSGLTASSYDPLASNDSNVPDIVPDTHSNVRMRNEIIASMMPPRSRTDGLMCDCVECWARRHQYWQGNTVRRLRQWHSFRRLTPPSTKVLPGATTMCTISNIGYQLTFPPFLQLRFDRRRHRRPPPPSPPLTSLSHPPPCTQVSISAHSTHRSVQGPV